VLTYHRADNKVKRAILRQTWAVQQETIQGARVQAGEFTQG